MNSTYRLAALLVWLSALTACTVVNTARTPTLDPAGQWVLLPLANNTDTPQAGLRAEAITESLLASLGRPALRYPNELRTETVFEPTDRKGPSEPPLAWAKKQNARYALTGAVNEWRYKVGIDGEPAVGITYTLVDLTTGKTIWTAAGGRSGWSREALSAVAHKLIVQLLSGLRAG